jgi:hypothetical protein
LEDLKSGLAKAGDVRLWTHHHPWAAVGVAAATGFSLAALVLGRGGGENQDDPEPPARHSLLEQAAKAPYDDYTSRRSPKVSETLLGSLFNLARTALEASLLSAIRAEGVERAQQAVQPDRASMPPTEQAQTAD